MMKRHMGLFLGLSLMSVAVGMTACGHANREAGNLSAVRCVDALSDSITRIVDSQPGEIGVALIVNDRDTVRVNDRSVYPMMSVFKLHQAIAVCDSFDRASLSLDSVVEIPRVSLNPDTWSPMLKEHTGKIITLPVRDLLRYTLIYSDNNASNYMFDSLVDVASTDSLIATLIPRSSFQIAYTEEDMFNDHDKAYSNYTSPLGAAELINRLFTDSLLSSGNQEFITATLGECLTGRDRIIAPLLDKKGVSVAHKTGSGYTNERGELVAHNDVAFIRLPDGSHYSLAVFVKDFKGDETEASRVVSEVSAAVYSLIADSESR